MKPKVGRNFTSERGEGVKGEVKNIHFIGFKVFLRRSLTMYAVKVRDFWIMAPCFFSKTSMTICNAKHARYNMSVLPRMKLTINDLILLPSPKSALTEEK